MYGTSVNLLSSLGSICPKSSFAAISCISVTVKVVLASVAYTRDTNTFASAQGYLRPLGNKWQVKTLERKLDGLHDEETV